MGIFIMNIPHTQIFGNGPKPQNKERDKEMKMVEIFKLAYYELLRRIETEEKHADGPIKQHRLPMLKEKAENLYRMILIEEAK